MSDSVRNIYQEKETIIREVVKQHKILNSIVTITHNQRRLILLTRKETNGKAKATISITITTNNKGKSKTNTGSRNRRAKIDQIHKVTTFMKITEVVDMNKRSLRNSTHQANGREKKVESIRISPDSTIIIPMIERKGKNSINRNKHTDIDNITKIIDRHAKII